MIVINLSHGIPIFGEVKQVFVVDGDKVVFECTKLSVIELDIHVNAYSVSRLNEVTYILQSELLDFYPLGLTKGFGCNATKLFVILKYRVDCLL